MLQRDRSTKPFPLKHFQPKSHSAKTSKTHTVHNHILSTTQNLLSSFYIIIDRWLGLFVLFIILDIHISEILWLAYNRTFDIVSNLIHDAMIYLPTCDTFKYIG